MALHPDCKPQHYLAARAAHPLRPLLALLWLALPLALPQRVRAQADRQPYVTNGQVNAIVRDGGTVYIGGSFTYVGPNIPNGSALNAGTGAPNLRSARPNGAVNAAVPDGAGGWYIGGAFTQVGGLARNRIAQLDATGAVTGFNPDASGPVSALAVAGGTVYAGGSLGNIGGLPRAYLVALNAVTGVPLPVELVAFTATAAGPTGYNPAAVRLAWATASEKNSARFEVERSATGREFARIGTVAAGGGSSARRYEWLDAKLPTGAATLYYRLRLVDLDGTFSYSPVRTVALAGAAAGLALYPNPAQGAATLTGALPGTVVTVYDALGRPMTSATADAAGTAALVLPAGSYPVGSYPVGLPAGVYVVRAGTQAVRLTVE